MMKNGRPYTNESGYIDNANVTALNSEEKSTVLEWIKTNIKPARRILKGKTSYGLKHILERDTGIYLTNNQFKEAMLSAGFSPINPNELYWRYRIILVREINNNPSSFFKWAKKFKGENSPRGDFARDMIADFDFPKKAEHRTIKRYLKHICACSGAIDAFEEMWSDYARERN